jgi:hypothetical protein
LKITEQYDINNLEATEDVYDIYGYWNRFVEFKFHDKLDNENGYDFVNEIQSLSNQIHFGLASCFLLRAKISTKGGFPNQYNHRYTFMIESTIHCVYAYWNRVAHALNTYLKSPKRVKVIYFASVVEQLLNDYPELAENEYYMWLSNVKINVECLKRNEFAHNYSLIMQDFSGLSDIDSEKVYLLALPEVLLSHNIHIVDEIYNLVNLIECVENLNEVFLSFSL